MELYSTENFKVNDVEGQKLLDKYMPKTGNSHVIEMLEIFQVAPFKELKNDAYLWGSLASDPLLFVFYANDVDFIAKIRKELNFKNIEEFVDKTIHNKDMVRDVLNYLSTKI